MSSISLAGQASLILATFELKAVEAVTGAIRAADLASGDVLGPAGIIEKPEPQPGRNFRYTPEPVIEPRRHIHPEPVYERRRVIHPEPRVAKPLFADCPPTGQPWPPEPNCSSPSSPIEPPWKVLPWMDRYPKRVVYMMDVKGIGSGPDMVHKGVMIDVLI